MIMNKDPKILSAKTHWQGRMVSNGIPLSDFNDVINSIETWDDWCVSWSKKGEIHSKLGEDAIKDGSKLTASHHFITASVCYHFGKYLFVHKPSEMKIAHNHCVNLYKKALPLMKIPGERVEIPFKGKLLYGNLRKPKNTHMPPLVIMVMGLDSSKEEMYHNEIVFLERGMATLAFDGPGQGEGEYIFPIEPEYEKPVQAVIDFVDKRKDINLEKIGLWGVSLGGYYAPRAASFIERLKACVSLSGPFNFGECFDHLPKLTSETFIYRSGSKTADEAKNNAKLMTLENCIINLKCPLYIVSGSLDKVIPPEQSDKIEKKAINSREIIHQKISDGGHVANNRAYKYRMKTADWMLKKLS